MVSKTLVANWSIYYMHMAFNRNKRVSRNFLADSYINYNIVTKKKSSKVAKGLLISFICIISLFVLYFLSSWMRCGNNLFETFRGYEGTKGTVTNYFSPTGGRAIWYYCDIFKEGYFYK